MIVVESQMDEYEWHDNRMSVQHLRETEAQTCADTTEKDAKGATTLTNLINIFFRLSYHCAEPRVIDSDDDWFLSIAYLTYVRVPYTLHCIRELWMRGHYLEAVILFRHLLEGLVVLRYFQSRREKVEAHFTATSRKGTVSLRDMFDTYAPGLHDGLYRLVSECAHGKVAASMFQTEWASSTGKEILMGREFHADPSGYVYVITGIVSYGYLNHASTFFPSMDSNLDAITLERKAELLRRLKCTLLTKREHRFVHAILPLVAK